MRCSSGIDSTCHACLETGVCQITNSTVTGGPVYFVLCDCEHGERQVWNLPKWNTTIFSYWKIVDDWSRWNIEYKSQTMQERKVLQWKRAVKESEDFWGLTPK